MLGGNTRGAEALASASRYQMTFLMQVKNGQTVTVGTAAQLNHCNLMIIIFLTPLVSLCEVGHGTVAVGQRHAKWQTTQATPATTMTDTAGTPTGH